MNALDVVSIRGTLKVKYRNSRFGPFPVAQLHTSIGTFSVRDSKDDAWLESLQEGDYAGIFEISKIFLHSYSWNGESHTCVRAQVASYQLDGFEDEIVEDNQYLPDPMEEEGDTINRDELTSEIAGNEADENVALLASFLDAEADWEYGDDYRIDTTIGRINILQCRKALETLGYALDTRSQTWYLPSDGGDV